MDALRKSMSCVVPMNVSIPSQRFCRETKGRIEIRLSPEFSPRKEREPR